MPDFPFEGLSLPVKPLVFCQLKQTRKFPISKIPLALCLLLGLASCGDSTDIIVYSIPKEQFHSGSGKGPNNSALGTYLSKVVIGDLPAHLVKADNDGKSVRVFVLKFEGKTWFFKLMGSTELAIREEANFDKFVRSIDIQSEQIQDNWFIPEGWEPGKKSSMRIGSFTVQDGDDSALDISVTAFPGDLGGLLPNVERWLGQIGLNPGTE